MSIASLEGKRAIVTGAASGIGRASAQALMRAGATVVGIDKSTPAASEVPLIAADLAKEEQIIAAVSEARARLGGVDILVNAAGVMQESPLSAVTADSVDLHFDINVRGTILVTREVLSAFEPGSRIINVTSELAMLGRQNASTYVATKAAIVGLTRSWAREFAPKILVNAVGPGPTDTPLLGFDSMTDEQKALELAHPLGRLGQSSEVADAVVFLSGSGATFITGHCLAVNGGAAMT